MKRLLLATLALAFASASVQGQVGATVPNWTVPSSRSSSFGHPGALHTLDDLTPPLPFIGVTPCRIVDTRGLSGPFGAPALSPGTPRTFHLSAGPCAGIPATVSAYSLNITVTNTQGAGDIRVYPSGTATPLVSTLNYVAGQTVANAAIVPANGARIAVLADVHGTDLIIDINGYFTDEFDNVGGFAVYGSAKNGPLVFSQNSAPGGIGVEGNADQDGDGVRGASSQGYGVHGISVSTDGVFGEDASGPPAVNGTLLSAGVRGASVSHVGVGGLSEYVAVAGDLLSGGAVIARGFLGSTIGTGQGSTSGPWGVFSQGDFGASGAKHFVEPHPSDPGKVIVYTSIEGRTADTYFRGSARFVNHEAVIEVPEDFRVVTDEAGLTVQVTPIGGFASTYVESRDLNRIVVKSSSDVAFDYLVQGVRRAFKDLQPVRAGYEFMPESADQKMPAYLTEEARRRLIANGTYNEDGSVNMATADRLGWTRIWKERDAQIPAAAERESARQAITPPEHR